MAKESRAEPGAFRGALDQTGDIGDDEPLTLRQIDDAEIGRQGRERIVGDLGPGRAGRRQEGRFAGVWQADEASVGDQLEP